MNLNQQPHFPVAARRKRKLSSVTTGLVAVSIIVVCFSACVGWRDNIKNTPPPPLPPTPTPKVVRSPRAVKSAPAIDIPKLMRQPPEVFEESFGEATEIFKGDKTVEIREYEIPGVTKTNLTKAGLTIHFYKGKAIRITVDLLAPTSSAEEALSQVKIDAKGVAPSEKRGIYVIWFNRSLNGIKFEKVWASSSDSDSQNFTTVQATVQE